MSIRWRECFSDQHYFATLLSFKGYENQTACNALLTHSSTDTNQPGVVPLEAITSDGCELLLHLIRTLSICTSYSTYHVCISSLGRLVINESKESKIISLGTSGFY